MVVNSLKVFVKLLILLFCSIGTANAQNLILEDHKKSYPLQHPLYLVDEHQDFSSTQVIHNTNFKPAKLPTLSLGATNSAVWIKVHILNKTQNTDWYLQIDSPPVLHSVEVYQKKATGLFKTFTVHNNKSKSLDQIKVNDLLIPIDLPQNTEVEYYIRATSNNILRLPLKVTTLQTNFEQRRSNDLLNGITFGILMTFVIYNLFVYLLTRERTYLYYLIYIFFWSLNLFFYNGFLPYIFTSLIWLNSAGIIIAIASLFSVFFTNSFLKTKTNSPFFYKTSLLLSLLLLIVLFTDIFFRGAYSFIMIQYLMYPVFIYWFGAGIQSLKKGYKPGGH